MQQGNIILESNTIHITQKISQSGLCSRREAKKLVFDGSVRVNGVVISNPAIQISVSDAVEVNGEQLSSSLELKLWLYHKPISLITTHKDPQNRPTVFEALPKKLGRVVSVGRLDINSEGLLLITNVGEFARFLELPTNSIIRKYKVRAFGKVDKKKLASIEKGCTIEGIRYGNIQIAILTSAPNNNWFEITLHEGKNREIRKILKFCGLEVNKLIRIQYGPYLLEDLKQGAIKEVQITKELYENYLRKA